MNEFVFFIDGNVDHPLTIDPSVWIFDERKIDLHTYFDELATKEDEETAYKKAISAQWDKEITEGSEPPNPNSNQNRITIDKKKLAEGSFGMPLKPFLANAEPHADTTHVDIHKQDGTTERITYEQALAAVAGFADKGQPLREDGPIHLYFGDGSNRKNPIKFISRFTLLKE
ncbi:peptidyl-prolyl cis-trans isomerase [Halalkalibacter oceani]|uniref:Peptidyl-prolyl cis-trans isomerase n=1 Tax=Halalkalibacter oceani TaxID=1653776 RepID=A0A9X2DML1_9BACI|nr:peptidyl-prolyl cis-trans isomerase [Halalkalibacter oceani]MCM3713058.1 peptidyl-prolyl cis-trans isomerase [Halalkalibacter oceani]